VLTSERLARALGVTPKTIQRWTSEGTLPPSCYTLLGAGARSGYEFNPRAAMIGQLVLELGELFGTDNSPLPKRIAAALREQLDRIAWDDTRDRQLTVTAGGFTLTADLSFLKTAKQKLAALEAA
jgi:hypothetical protein